jgi:hypothetical protein
VELTCVEQAARVDESLTRLTFLEAPPRFLFFTGKGGVGKTSLACASAVRLTTRGARVLLVSTDPASNIGQVFGLPVGNTRTPIPDVPGLSALEIDPQQAADAYRARIIDPVRTQLPPDEVDAMTEQLSGACTTEIASFSEFTSLLANPDVTAGYDHVLFDTAPHRPHDPAPSAARRVDHLPLRRQGRRLVPRPGRGPGPVPTRLPRSPGRPDRPHPHPSGHRQSPPAVRSRRGLPHLRRAASGRDERRPPRPQRWHAPRGRH